MTGICLVVCSWFEYLNYMDAQMVVIFQNGFAEARNPLLRNRFEVIALEKSTDIKSKVLENLKRLGRQGSVLVKWKDQMYLCELKQNGEQYARMEIEYHPYSDKFTI